MIDVFFRYRQHRIDLGIHILGPVVVSLLRIWNSFGLKVNLKIVYWYFISTW